MEEQKPHLCEAIDFERDIKPYRLIRLYAGVGAGKNEWTEKLAEQGYTILVITSRANTATAQARKLDAKRHFRLEDIIEAADAWGETPLDRVCCTNSDIEKYARDTYDPDNPKTHIWNLFDFIVLDEAHSLTADAGFSTAPFYVIQFLKYAYKKNRKCHIVLMSGTQEPVDWVFAGERSQAAVHELNFFEQCRHIEPERVRFWPQFGGINQVIKGWKKGERCIYFANSIESIKDCVKRLTAAGIPEADIGISYSDKGRDKDFSEELVGKKERIRNMMIETERIPEDVKIFLTTSKNKEGINIRDDDITAMFTESCQRDELVQMAGRVRSGLKHFCILYDAKQHANRMTTFQRELENDCLNVVRENAQSFLKDYPGQKKSVIKKVEEMFEAIRYDPFQQEFYIYQGRMEGAIRSRQDQQMLKECIENYDCEVYPYGVSGEAVLQQWFPYSRIECRELTYNSERAVIEAVRNLVNEKGYFGVELGKEDMARLTAELNELLSHVDPRFIPSSYPIQRLGAALKQYQLRLDPVTSSHSNVKKIIIDNKDNGEKGK